MVSEDVSLDGRRILLISPRFFGYEQRILDHLSQRQAEVVYLDERPANSPLGKAWLRFKMPFHRTMNRLYYKRSIDSLADQKFTDVLVISPEACDAIVVARLRKAFPEAQFRLYMWDSFVNKGIGDPERYIRQFDLVLSFDDLDANAYGIAFRPLFYCDSGTFSRNSAVSRYALSFAGTIHGDRYKVLKAVFDSARQANLPFFFYPFLPSRMAYWFYRFTRREFRGTRPGDFQFRPLPYAKVVEIYAASSAIVDVEHPRQRGLTMRSIEVIGSGRKLLTTNANVRNYPFFAPDRVMVIDRERPTLDPAFFQSATQPLEEGLVHAYSLAAWVDELFELTPKTRGKH